MEPWDVNSGRTQCAPDSIELFKDRHELGPSQRLCEYQSPSLTEGHFV